MARRIEVEAEVAAHKGVGKELGAPAIEQHIHIVNGSLAELVDDMFLPVREILVWVVDGGLVPLADHLGLTGVSLAFGLLVSELSTKNGERVAY